jgi:hypothetical protein
VPVSAPPPPAAAYQPSPASPASRQVSPRPRPCVPVCSPASACDLVKTTRAWAPDRHPTGCMAHVATYAMQAWPARAPLPSLFLFCFILPKKATWKPYWAGPLFKSARPRLSRPFNSFKILHSCLLC